MSIMVVLVGGASRASWLSFCGDSELRAVGLLGFKSLRINPTTAISPRYCVSVPDPGLPGRRRLGSLR
jgi:hypothetical protein